MTLITQTEAFWYGCNPVKKPLPQGWEYIERDKAWLLCVSPEGELFFTDGSLRAARAGISDVAKWRETGMIPGELYCAEDISKTLTIQ